MAKSKSKIEIGRDGGPLAGLRWDVEGHRPSRTFRVGVGGYGVVATLSYRSSGPGRCRRVSRRPHSLSAWVTAPGEVGKRLPVAWSSGTVTEALGAVVAEARRWLDENAARWAGGRRAWRLVDVEAGVQVATWLGVGQPWEAAKAAGVVRGALIPVEENLEGRTYAFERHSCGSLQGDQIRECECGMPHDQDGSGSCQSCDFWSAWLAERERTPGMLLVIDGMAYSVGPEAPSRMRGFGGRKFKIRLKTGEVVETTNLWHNGEAPTRFRDRMPDDAEFVREPVREMSFDARRETGLEP